MELSLSNLVRQLSSSTPTKPLEKKTPKTLILFTHLSQRWNPPSHATSHAPLLLTWKYSIEHLSPVRTYALP